jgi:hypothetical protein
VSISRVATHNRYGPSGKLISQRFSSYHNSSNFTTAILSASSTISSCVSGRMAAMPVFSAAMWRRLLKYVVQTAMAVINRNKERRLNCYLLRFGRLTVGSLGLDAVGWCGVSDMRKFSQASRLRFRSLGTEL